jgi:hypothetical protein
MKVAYGLNYERSLPMAACIFYLGQDLGLNFPNTGFLNCVIKYVLYNVYIT